MDISDNMLTEAQRMNPNLHFEKGDILNLKFNNNSIAGIVAFYSIIHFSKEQVIKSFSKIFRVLKLGGIFLFTFHVGDKIIHLDEYLGRRIDIDFIYHNSEHIIQCLEKTGFKKICIHERQPYKRIESESKRAYVFASK